MYLFKYMFELFRKSIIILKIFENIEFDLYIGFLNPKSMTDMLEVTNEQDVSTAPVEHTLKSTEDPADARDAGRAGVRWTPAQPQDRRPPRDTVPFKKKQPFFQNS